MEIAGYEVFMRKHVMKSLLIVGAGGYGFLVKEIASLCGYEKIDFLDDNSPYAIAKVDSLTMIQDAYDGTMVAIGNHDVRERLLEKVTNPVNLIHPKAVVSPSAVIGNACVIEAGAIVNTNVRLGNSCFICAGAVVNHDAIVGDYCQIDCNAVVDSSAKVMAKTKVASCTVYKR